MTTELPQAPPEEDARDACCSECGSLFHPTSTHKAQDGLASLAGLSREEVMTVGDEFPPGYDSAEADRLIGRNPDGPTAK